MTIFMIALTIVVSNISLAAQANPPGTNKTPFGVESEVAYKSYPGGSWPSMTDEASAMADRGVRWAREAFLWLGIEPTQGTFFWTRTDYLVQQLKTNRDIEILGVLMGTPAWASPAPTDPNYMWYPPSDLNKWYTYVYQTVSRYKGSVRYWEIWNEPDYPQNWLPAPNPQAYAQLIIKTYDAAKAADPNCLLILGGISWPDENALSFLQAVYNAGAWSKFDIVAVHSLHANRQPEEILYMETQKRFAAGLIKFGAKPIWYTEIGWSTNPSYPDGVSHDTQANYLVRYIVGSIGQGIGRIFWYNFRDHQSNSANFFDNFGIVNYNYVNKSSAVAFANMNNQLGAKDLFGRRDPFLSTRKVLDTYEDSSGRSGNITITTEQKYTGNFSGKLSYSFVTPGESAGGSHDVSVPGTPTKIGLWVYRNNCSNALTITFFDVQGEYFLLGLGHIIGFGWEYMEGSLQSAIYASGSGNHTVDFPIKIAAVLLSYDTNYGGDNKTSGSIYVDDLSSNTGDVGIHDYQFISGTYLTDVVWTDNSLSEKIPFLTKSLTVVNRDGTNTQSITDGGTGDEDGVLNNQIVISASGEPKYVTWQGTMAYILDGYGGVHSLGNVPVPSPATPYFGWNIAKDLELTSSGAGFYVLDGYGGVHRGGTAAAISPATPYFGWDIARDLELTSSGTGYYVLDGYGGVHPGGTATVLSPSTPYFGWDIARDLELMASGTGYYVLDGYGGVHRGGTATVFSPASSYFGWNIARDLELTSSGTGYYVLDGYGGIHAGGTAASLSQGPLWGWDIAKTLKVK
jgi:hypothetical protein